jgi:chemosensory pili system protein ChpC
MTQQSKTLNDVVRTQLLPLSNMNLVLPNTCIAEIINLQPIEPIKKSADWLLGMTSWRGVHIPVISFERANTMAMDEYSKVTRIAVLNSLGNESDLPFYGIITQGIPKLLAVEKTDINAIKKPDVELPIAQQQTMINNEAAVIPDQLLIEKMLKKEGIKVS